MPDCDVAIADASEFLACTSEVIEPVLDVIYTVGSLAVLITVIIVGVKFAQKVVRMFNPNDEFSIGPN